MFVLYLYDFCGLNQAQGFVHHAMSADSAYIDHSHRTSPAKYWEGYVGKGVAPDLQVLSGRNSRAHRCSRGFSEARLSTLPHPRSIGLISQVKTFTITFGPGVICIRGIPLSTLDLEQIYPDARGSRHPYREVNCSAVYLATNYNRLEIA